MKSVKSVVLVGVLVLAALVLGTARPLVFPHNVQTVAALTMTNQTTAIPKTTVFSPTIDGNYRLSVYATVSGTTGAVFGQIFWSDEFHSDIGISGTSSAGPNGTTLVLEEQFRATSGSDISIETSIFSGSPTYDFYAVVERIN